MYYIGIDLGGTNIAAGMVNDKGNIVYKKNLSTKRERSHNDIIKDMARLINNIIDDTKIPVNQIESIGIGVPGIVNREEGNVIFCPNINFDNVPLRSELNKYIDLPIYLENDANCAALAESIFGSAKDAKNSITITLGTGIGGGIIIDGKIYVGFNGAAAEFGHMIIKSNGKRCGCGEKGCWEAYASATALIEDTKRTAKNNPEWLINKIVGNDLLLIDAKVVFDVAKQGDEMAIKVVKKYIGYLAEGLVNIINLFQPEVIVIGGGVSNQGEFLLNSLRELVYANMFCAGGILKTQINLATLGNDAGIIGAAMLERKDEEYKNNY